MNPRHGGLVRLLLLSLALSAVRTSGQTTEAAPEEDAACVGIEGNNDMYGLGIRVGVYLQSFALALATVLQQKSYSGIAFAAVLFQLSMLVGVVYVTATDDALEAAEAAIITIFTLCSSADTSPQLLVGDRPPEQHHRCDLLKLKLLGGHGPPKWEQEWVVPFVKSLVDLGTFVYSVWFWFAGLDVLTHTPCTGYAFFFARVSLYGWLRVLMKIVVVLLMVVRLYLLLSMLDVVKLSDWWCGTTAEDDATDAAAAEEGKAAPDQRVSQFEYPRWLAGRVVSAILPVGFWVMVVELMIHWNHISGIYTINTVGQLIPFLTGVGSFLSFLLDWHAPVQEGPALLGGMFRTETNNRSRIGTGSIRSYSSTSMRESSVESSTGTGSVHLYSSTPMRESSVESSTGTGSILWFLSTPMRESSVESSVAY